jgi:fatty acid desaturase
MLHRPDSWKHFALVFRQLFLLAVAVSGILFFDSIYVWLPCSIVIGFVIFDFTVLLHEVVHNSVFRSAKNRTKWNTWLGWLYAIPCGLAKSQFTRWHLDHHAELGSWEDDPKRAHLTPKTNKRWVKLLYMTPALFPIYFRAAAQEAETYPEDLRQKVQRERRITIMFHLALILGLILSAGFVNFLKLYAIPYFFVFPVVFTINRVGQHYHINPDDIAHWTTLMKGHWFWDRAFLFSNYHLEHHYFPGIPCYNLPALQQLLTPVYEKHGIKPQTYSRILYGWFILNHSPHTNWDLEESSSESAIPQSAPKNI